MHTELRACLEGTLEQSAPAAADLFEISVDLYRSIISTVRPVAVSDCPLPECGELASEVAFAIAAALTKRLERQIEPLRIAAFIVGEFNRDGADQFFAMTVGSQGHINVAITRTFIEQFLDHVDRAGSSELFQHRSFLFRSEVAQRDTMKEMRCRAWDSERWHAAAKRADDSELRQLILGSSTSSATPEERGRRMMAFAMLADQELDPSLFLRGLKGRENIPWYLESFRRDSRTILSRIEKLLRSHRQELPAPNLMIDIPTAQRPIPSRERYLRESEMLILSTRETVLRSVRNDRPEFVVGHLVHFARAFYRLFNHPINRFHTAESPTELRSRHRELLDLSRTVRVSRGVVEEGLKWLSPVLQ